MAAAAPAISVEEGTTNLLVLCGGGKDSLVTMRLLERAGIDYDAFIYSHSTYGRGQAQHLLVDAGGALPATAGASGVDPR